MNPDWLSLAWRDLPYVEPPLFKGRLKQAVDDFIVHEQLSFEPDGEGEHVLLYLEKTGLDTEQVVKQLSQWAGVAPHAIGYAGRKDRHARTRQWFSVQLPGKNAPAMQRLEHERLAVLSHTRHGRKLRHGAVQANFFQITLRNLHGPLERIPEALARIQTQGVPNYFGGQRFGNHGANLVGADALFQGKKVRRPVRGLYWSAARALLFNRILARRVTDGTWNQILPGERLLLAGSRSHFAHDPEDADLHRRVAEFDLHPSGWLPGAGGNSALAAVLALENEVLAEFTPWLDGLCSAAIAGARRALRVRPEYVDHQQQSDTLSVQFALPTGSFATALLRELMVTEQD
ncbi:MAG: tRNA pseudouridine(13) synthase TruD [Methylococcales bacterium]|nr:tRNA pseudouridine(13) synthase TruD [Methylococcales bacterium]